MVLGFHPSRLLHPRRLLISPYTKLLSLRFIHIQLLFEMFCVFAQECKATKEKCCSFRLLPHTSKICSSAGKFTFLHKPRKKCTMSLDYRVQDSPSSSYLKLLLTSGFFTFLTTQQALAGSDAATSLQSILGDAGDISTGFASVRKFSL